MRKVAPPPGNQQALRRHVDSATNWSVLINVILTAVKVWTFYVSGSLAVLASLVDSGIDLVQTGVLYGVERKIQLPADRDFPAGRAKLEPVGVVVCAVCTFISSAAVIWDSVSTLLRCFQQHNRPDLDLSTEALIVLVATVLSKAGLWIYCAAVADDSSTALALAEDHANDVASNAVAILASTFATWHSDLWYLDGLGAILISLYIVISWYNIAVEQIDHLIGKGADDDLLNELETLVVSHCTERGSASRRLPTVDDDPEDDPGIDCHLLDIRAYHFGPSYFVEVDLAVDDDTFSVSRIHHFRRDLTADLEALDYVERCFVSVQFQKPGTPTTPPTGVCPQSSSSSLM